MNPDRQQAINYFRAPANGLWRWAENGAVVVWRDGTTIAFREEIVQIIEWLAPNGLPSFGAIVFLLAACRGKMPTMADIIAISTGPLPTKMGSDAAVLQGARAQLKAQLEAALAELAKVSKLPAEVISGIKPKCVLAEAVFEPAKVERHVEARVVLSGLREPISDGELIDTESPIVSGRYLRQIHIVAEGLKPHSVESLTLRARTGLDVLPEAVDASLSAAERARRLIEELSRDRDLGSVARAAREFLAAVRLPRRLGERDQLALGGVADITNRGPLDRLLLSELAHDDLTLAVRVALNEALYLRREPPMREPPGALALLLDSGVRLWGVPRVLATAVALALIARDKQHSEILAWRSQGKDLRPVDLLSRHGLAQHLGVLEPSVHAGESLKAFGDAAAKNAQNQSVLITHPDALGDAEFRRSLSECPEAPGFIATVDRDGRFELHALPLAHRPPVCEADLDLATIFDERTAVAPIKVDVNPELPAIFGVTPFPFLLPLAGNVNFWVKGADDLNYAVLDDRRLAQFGNPQSGARILANDLPGGPTIWMDCDGTDLHLVKSIASQRPARLLSVTLPHGQLRVTDLLSGEEVHAVHRYGDVILLMRRHDVRAYALADGRLLGQATNPHVWVHGRFFRGTKHFYFAAWDGERVKFEPVTMAASYTTENVTLVFDRSGLGGPWLLTRTGSVVSLESGDEIKLPAPKMAAPASFYLTRSNQALISRDGHRMLISTSQRGRGDQPEGYLFDLNEEPKAIIAAYTPRVFERYRPTLPSWNVIRHLKSVAISRDAVGLCSRKDRWWKLSLDDQQKLRISTPAVILSNLPVHKFPEQPVKTRHGCALRTAVLINGSKVCLDSRGLLHFKSANPDLPEVSLILAEGEVAGWTSDGCVCGPKFFFDGPYASDPVGVFKHVLNIVGES